MNGKLLVIRVVSFSSILRLRVLVDAWFALLSHAQKQLIEPPSRRHCWTGLTHMPR